MMRGEAIRLDSSHLLLNALLVAQVSFTSLAAQEGGPACGAACRFSSTRVFTLGDDDKGLVGPEAQIAQIGDYFYISDQTTPTSIQVFGRGGFEGVLGREGQGPGEFKYIMAISADSDGRLWVLDGAQSRLTVLDVEGVHATGVNTITLPGIRAGRRSLSLVGADRFLLNGAVASLDLIGSWTHLVARSGEVLWSVDDDPERAKLARADPRLYAVAGREEFLSVWGTGEYRVDRRRLSDGALVSYFEPRRPWFDQHRVVAPPRRDANWHVGAFPSPARIQDVALRGNDLWVLGGFSGDRGWEQVIDVFDAATGRLLYTHAFVPEPSSYFCSFVAPDLTVSCEGSGTRLGFHRMVFSPG